MIQKKDPSSSNVTMNVVFITIGSLYVPRINNVYNDTTCQKALQGHITFTECHTYYKDMVSQH